VLAKQQGRVRRDAASTAARLKARVEHIAGARESAGQTLAPVVHVRVGNRPQPFVCAVLSDCLPFPVNDVVPPPVSLFKTGAQ
jgi:hypothetical protein